MGSANIFSAAPIPDTADVQLTSAAVNAALTASSATVVAPIAGKRIFVFGMFLQASAAGPFTIQDVSGSSTVALTGPLTMLAGVPLTLPYQQYPWFTCVSGDALVFQSAGTVTLAGRIMYMQG